MRRDRGHVPSRLRRCVVAALAVCPIVTAHPLAAAPQAPPPEAAAGAYRLDFTVPETPAFNLLDVDESSILRPATVRSLALALSEFAGPGLDVSIPQAFSAEFAPALLVRGRTLTREAYARHAWLYRTRVSAATRRSVGDAGPTRLALGVRTALVDDADLRTSPEAEGYARFVSEVLLPAVRAEDDVGELVMRLTQQGASESLARAVRELLAAATPAARERALDAAGVTRRTDREAVLAFIEPQSDAELAERIDVRRRQLQEELWNARVVEVAVAALAVADDPSGTGIDVDRVAAWLTAGFPVGGAAQLLVGGEAGVERDPTAATRWDPRGAVGTRLYAGSNELKLFLEIEGDFQSGRRPELLFNSGGEIHPPVGGWIAFSAGLNRDAASGEYRLVGDLQWSFGLEGLPLFDGAPR